MMSPPSAVQWRKPLKNIYNKKPVIPALSLLDKILDSVTMGKKTRTDGSLPYS
jgi:hypothetical protein